MTMISIVSTTLNWLVTAESHFVEELEADLHLLIGVPQDVPASAVAKLQTLEGVVIAAPAPEPVAIPTPEEN